MQTVGKKITELTPSSGFCAELAAAITVVLASRTGIPVSTTHILVGSVFGVGLARGVGALDLRVVLNFEGHIWLGSNWLKKSAEIRLPDSWFFGFYL